MTILQKLSDRDGFIYDVIKCILVNAGPMDMKKLQFVLLTCGVYVKKDLLEQALKTMNEKGLLTKPQPKPKIELPKIIMP